MRAVTMMMALVATTLTALPASAQKAKPQPQSQTRHEHNAYDPGGTYKGYPDWARQALAPKGGQGK